MLKIPRILCITCIVYNISLCLAYNERSMRKYLEMILGGNQTTSECTVIALAPVIGTYVDGYPLEPGSQVKHNALIRYSCPSDLRVSARSIQWDNCHHGLWYHSLTRMEKSNGNIRLFRCKTNSGECGIPSIPHSNMEDEFSKALEFANNTVLHVKCANNTIPVDKAIIMCINNQWLSPGDLEKLCQPIESSVRDIAVKREYEVSEDITYLGGDCQIPFIPGGVIFYQYNDGYRAINLDKYSNLKLPNKYSIRVSCNNTGNYPDIGDEYLSCSNGAWIALDGWPNCQAPCSVVNIANTIPEKPPGSLVDSGQELKYICPHGLYFPRGETRRSLKCQNGYWESFIDDYVCKKPADLLILRDPFNDFEAEYEDLSANQDMKFQFTAPCWTPLISSSIGNLSELIRHGDTHEVQCEPGWTLHGARTITCIHGQWSFYGAWPRCS